jgi:virulence-associated protein VagC
MNQVNILSHDQNLIIKPISKHRECVGRFRGGQVKGCSEPKIQAEIPAKKPIPSKSKNKTIRYIDMMNDHDTILI